MNAKTGKNIKGIIMAFISVMTIVTLSLPVHAWSTPTFAYDPYTSTLTISGNRELLKDDLCEISGKGYEPENLVIGEGITSIDEEMFQSWHWLRTVSLPWSLRKIGARAFDNSIKRVNYNGNHGRWEGIEIEKGNESMSGRVKFLMGFSYESIKVTSMPHKTEYKAGEYFDPEGMVVKAVITDFGRPHLERIIDDYTIDQEEPLYQGQRRVYIHYNNCCQEESTYVPITVN